KRHCTVEGDGHYTGTEEQRTRWYRLLDKIRADSIDEFSIMGDFYELWLALDGAMPLWQNEMLKPLYALRDAGVTLRYVIGNKDYFVEDWNRRECLFHSVIDGSERIDSAQGPLYLAHGDLVNHADTQYRRWRAFSRSWGVSLFARALPRSTLLKLGERVAKKLESTNRTHKMYYPLDQLEARARELPAGPATQIYGHFHTHRELHFDDKRVITLPFLLTENAGVLVDDRGFHRFEA
ncbi:MAG: hypothetical protein AAFQ82_17945, partial [Myxococcota bacterium]